MKARWAAAELVRRGVRRSTSAVLHTIHRERDRRRGTYAVERTANELRPLLLSLPREARPNAEDARGVLGVAEHYASRRFDLLGSGWEVVEHGMRCRGFRGARYPRQPMVEADPAGLWLRGRIDPSNLGEAQRIWGMTDPGYRPIDWQLDFKSGFRWREGTWYRDIAYGRLPGVDVKVPWEIGRLQHLPQLALAAVLARTQGTGASDSEEAAHADRWARAVRNQSLDFIACNPPRYGVSWACTMDVAIRAVNLLVAHDLLRAGGWAFDSDYRTVLARSVYEHGRHIIHNLEWSSRARSNHYLANIVGLLFVAACLPRSPDVDVWLAFGIQELIREVEHQFLSDGGNFEASTCYHRLSAEMVAFGTAVIAGLPQSKLAALREYDSRLHRVSPALAPAPLPGFPADGQAADLFPEWYRDRLARMARFTGDVTRPDGQVVQFGDNDSGRLVKLTPRWRPLTVSEARARYRNLDGYDALRDEETYWDEDHLDHAHLGAALSALFGGAGAAAEDRRGALDAAVVRQLAVGSTLGRDVPDPPDGNAHAAPGFPAGTQVEWSSLCAEAETRPGAQVYRWPAPGADLCRDLSLAAYPETGVYVFRSPRLYLAVRCGPHGQDDLGGHAHNDQLSLELMLDGREVLTDPGTFVYTADPAARNAYRSVHAHYGPRLARDREPAPLDEGLFRLRDTAHARCLYFGPEGFAGCHAGYGDLVYRLLRVLPGEIVITDYTDGAEFLQRLTLPGERDTAGRAGAPVPDRGLAFSPGYGIQRA